MTSPEFLDAFGNKRYRKWFSAIWEDLRKGEAFPRMRHVQHALVDLIELLDPKHKRYEKTELEYCGGKDSNRQAGMMPRETV
jgi:hypothetical protein